MVGSGYSTLVERSDSVAEVGCGEHDDGEKSDDLTVGEDMSVTLTRQELYDRVWTEPVEKVAKEYGLSDVGLGKACRRHDIPVPPRGYWARKAAGQKLRRPPLPPAKDGDESVTLMVRNGLTVRLTITSAPSIL